MKNKFIAITLAGMLVFSGSVFASSNDIKVDVDDTNINLMDQGDIVNNVGMSLKFPESKRVTPTHQYNPGPVPFPVGGAQDDLGNRGHRFMDAIQFVIDEMVDQGKNEITFPRHKIEAAVEDAKILGYFGPDPVMKPTNQYKEGSFDPVDKVVVRYKPIAYNSKTGGVCTINFETGDAVCGWKHFKRGGDYVSAGSASIISKDEDLTSAANFFAALSYAADRGYDYVDIRANNIDRIATVDASSFSIGSSGSSGTDFASASVSGLLGLNYAKTSGTNETVKDPWIQVKFAVTAEKAKAFENAMKKKEAKEEKKN
ncbi:hypothetical protein ACFL08_01770 [Patescibacteria group bacterium]